MWRQRTSAANDPPLGPPAESGAVSQLIELGALSEDLEWIAPRARFERAPYISRGRCQGSGLPRRSDKNRTARCLVDLGCVKPLGFLEVLNQSALSETRAQRGLFGVQRTFPG